MSRPKTPPRLIPKRARWEMRLTVVFAAETACGIRAAVLDLVKELANTNQFPEPDDGNDENDPLDPHERWKWRCRK